MSVSKQWHALRYLHEMELRVVCVQVHALARARTRMHALARSRACVLSSRLTRALAHALAFARMPARARACARRNSRPGPSRRGAMQTSQARVRGRTGSRVRTGAADCAPLEEPRAQSQSPGRIRQILPSPRTQASIPNRPSGNPPRPQT
eukprot:6184271-Pleurochrysis_carterae.AAC.2